MNESCFCFFRFVFCSSNFSMQIAFEDSKSVEIVSISYFRSQLEFFMQKEKKLGSLS